MIDTKDTKIFCTGMYFTGATKVINMLEKMNYTPCRDNSKYITKHGEWMPDAGIEEIILSSERKRIIQHLTNYNVFRGDPWLYIYPELFYTFPKAKFIHLQQNIETLVKDTLSQYKNIHESEIGNITQKIKDRYNLHYIDFVKFFATHVPLDLRSKKMLVLDSSKLDAEDTISQLEEFVMR
jgi:hypothetical protein